MSKPRVTEQQPRYFRPEEIDALKSATENVRERAIFEVLYRTGVRCAELCNLTTGNLDQVNWRLHSIPCKRFGFRDVLLHVDARKAILDYLPERAELIASKESGHLALSEAERGRYPLFVSTYGAIAGEPRSFRHNEKSIWNLVHALGLRAGIEDAHPHRLRHTACIEFYRQCLDIDLTARFMGHSSVLITQRYLIRDKEEIDAIVGRMA